MESILFPRPDAARARPRSARSGLGVAVFIAAHALLAAAVRQQPSLGLLHVAATFCAVVFIAVARPPRDAASAVAYLTGAEVFWRMGRVGVFHEFAKYAVMLVVVIAMMRMRAPRNRSIAFAYFGLLLPSAILTVLAYDLDEARQQLSFNLSGPMSLALCVVFFSNLRVSSEDLRRIFLSFIAPALSIAAFTFLSTASLSEIQFTGESNRLTSGGFGPNQVSSALGLGLLFAVLLLLQRKSSWRGRLPLIGLALVFAVQAALTFSRAGLLLALAATFAATFYLVRERRTRVTLLVIGVLLYVVGKVVVVPRLDVFTGGKLAERYTSADPTGRTIIAGYDLQIFQDHPVLGVGPGVATEIRGEMGHFGAAHTEYTRMLAEHGLLGLVALVLLLYLGVRTLRLARTIQARALVSASLLWVLLFLAVNGMRTVAPSMMLGLACAIAYSSLPSRARAPVLPPNRRPEPAP